MGKVHRSRPSVTREPGRSIGLTLVLIVAALPESTRGG